jgi:small GTP-binding protein
LEVVGAFNSTNIKEDINNNNNNKNKNYININTDNNNNNNINLNPLNRNLTDILALKKIRKERTGQKSIINIVFLGDKCVGKTSLVFQYTTSKFDQYYIQTIAQEEFSKNVKIEGKNYSLNIIVTSGVPQYQEDYSQLYSEADFLVVCFDLTQLKSFEKAKEIIKNEVKSYIFLMQDNFANVVLIGNKSDLIRERKVIGNDISQFCKKYKIQFFETSAKTKVNVQGIFNKMIEVYDQVIS